MVCSEPFIEDRNRIAIWIEFLFHRHEVSQVLTLVPIAVANLPLFHHEILENPRVLLFRLLQPQGKSQSFFSRHLPVRICLCHRATVQQKRAPSAVSPWGDLQLPVARGNQFMELSLACPFPLCQFLEPRHIFPCVFGTARNSISHELQGKLHPFQRWIEAHQEQRIELRLECFSVDDLVVALPIGDLGLREGMKHHEVKCPLVGSYWSLITRMLNRNEVFIERNME